MTISNENERVKSAQKPKPALNFLLLSAGSVFTSMIIAGFLVGYAFDHVFGTTPLFLLGCGVLGFVGGILKIHKLLSNMDLLDTSLSLGKTDSEKKEQDKNAS